MNRRLFVSSVSCLHIVFLSTTFFSTFTLKPSAINTIACFGTVSVSSCSWMSNSSILLALTTGLVNIVEWWTFWSPQADWNKPWILSQQGYKLILIQNKCSPFYSTYATNSCWGRSYSCQLAELQKDLQCQSLPVSPPELKMELCLGLILTDQRLPEESGYTSLLYQISTLVLLARH